MRYYHLFYATLVLFNLSIAFISRYPLINIAAAVIVGAMWYLAYDIKKKIDFISKPLEAEKE